MKGTRFIILFSINLLNILCYNVDLVQGIRNGMIPGYGQFTYQVSIFINDEYACGGAALNRRNMLSAASCVLDEEGNFLDVTFEVVVDVIDLYQIDTKIKVAYIFIKTTFRPSSGVAHSHPRSFPNTLEKADISVLKLANNIPNDVYLTHVNIPRGSLKYTSKEPVIAGFGQNQPHEYVSSSTLNNLLYRRNTAGHLTYMKTRVGRTDICENHYPQFDDSHICANSKGNRSNIPAGVCFGDVGSPLVYNNLAIGVLQIYTADCDDRIIPAVYTRVSSFEPFITNAINGSYQVDMRLGNYTGAHVQEEPNPYRG